MDSDSPMSLSAAEEYQNDKRPACKYGLTCYQKNRAHLDKYKHPPKADGEGNQNEDSGEKHKKRFGTHSPIKNSKENVKQGGASPKRFKKDDTPSPNKDERKGRSPMKDGATGDRSSSNSQSVQPADELSHSGSHETENYENEPEIPPSPEDTKENLKQKFLFEMPEDFYSFWEFCKTLSPGNPASALKDVGLQPVGPYDVLSGKLKVPANKRKQPLYILHWRYYYDPPEFQTVLKGDDKRQFHMGYFRDEPDSLPIFIASNCAAKDGIFKQVAENIFGAVNVYLLDLKKSGNPFLQAKIPKLQKPLQDWAKAHDFTLDTKTRAMKERDKKVVTKTFHGLGLVVPVEKRTEVGYRELIETNANLKKILQEIINSTSESAKEKALDKLQPIITAANIANDECDFGTSIELGLDLFSFGGADLERSALQLLSTGYSLLKRKKFAQIAEVHIKNRSKDPLPKSF